jgi:hypothetical protein
MSEVGLMLLNERDKYLSPHRTIIAIALFAPEVNSALGATAFTISVETGVSWELIRCFIPSQVDQNGIVYEPKTDRKYL